MIRALVFDFDGLLVDTEEPEYRAWRETWADFGHDLTLEEWCRGIGTVGGFDPLDELAARVGAGFDRVETTERRRARHRPLIEALLPLPGVVDHLAAARRMGLATAIASSSDDRWVTPLLERLGLVDDFAHLSLFDGSCPAKPAPDLYLRACAALGVAPAEAIAYEDSPNGVAAAKAAGLWCVAVPHDLTRHLDLSAADLIASSLADVRLEDVLAHFGYC